MLVLAMALRVGLQPALGDSPPWRCQQLHGPGGLLVSNIILPVGSLIFLLFTVSKRGWGWKNFLAEANAGKGLKVKPWMRGYMTYVLPFLFLAIFIIGLVTYFQ